jgi:hypothetical protein
MEEMVISVGNGQFNVSIDETIGLPRAFGDIQCSMERSEGIFERGRDVMQYIKENRWSSRI